MNETLVSDLVALVRRSFEDNRAIAAAPWAFGVEAWPSILLELEELARRARTFGATDEEISLSIGVLLATSPAPAGPP